MKLSTIQIEQLYVFTRQHFVEYYDLQTELVDHLANAIEARWDENPVLTFDEILNSEFKKFGVFGFSDLVEKRQNAMTRKYNKLVLKELLSLFRLPTLVIPVAAFALVFYGLKNLDFANTIYLITFGALTFILFGTLIFETIKRKRRPVKQKRWLFEEIIFNHGSFASFLLLPVQVLSSFYKWDSFTSATTAIAVFSLLLVMYTLFSYVILMVMPKKATQYLRDTYPEYEFRNT